MARRPARLSLRETLQRSQASMDLYAALAGKPSVVGPIPIPPAPTPRKPRDPSAPPPAPLESEIQAEIIGKLRRHPLVALVERHNSGSAIESNPDGTQRYVAFHTVYRPIDRPIDAPRLRVADISATLRPHGRRLVIEVKRPPWRRPRNQREEEQVAYIEHIRAAGGLGLVATCWEDVRAVLEGV